MAYPHRTLRAHGLLLCAAFLGCDKTTPSGGAGEDMQQPALDLAEIVNTPKLTAVEPGAASNAGGARLTLTGANFHTNAAVTVGGAAAADVVVQSPMRITLTVPAKAGTCGPVDIQVQNPGNRFASRSDLFRYLPSALAFQDTQSLTYPIATPRAVLAEDINGDGKLDLVSVHSNMRAAYVRTGKGNGTFNDPMKLDTGASPFGLAVADVNGDARKDLVVANSADNNVGVYLQRTDGTFDPPVNVTVGGEPYGVAMADMDGDGKLDVVAVNNGSRNVSIRLGQGNGTFMAPPINANLSVGLAPHVVVLADVNKDGRPDILTSNNNGAELSLRLNNGNYAYGHAMDISVGQRPWGLVVADLNGDENLDVAAANQGDHTVTVRLGMGNGMFAMPQTLALPAGAGPRGLAVGDLDGDGKLDLISANYDGGTISVFTGKGTGEFNAAVTVPVGASPSSVAAADFNGDGIGDIVATSQTTANLSLRLGRCP